MKKIYSLFLLSLLFLGLSNVANAQTVTIAGWTFPTATGNAVNTIQAECGALQAEAIMYADGTNFSDNWSDQTSRLYFGGTNPLSPLCDVSTATGAFTLVNSPNKYNNKSIVFKLSMTGYKNLNLSYDTRGTNTGFKTHDWSCSVDGTNFSPIKTITGRNATNFSNQTVDFSSSTILNNEDVIYIKLTVSGASGTGNNRFDNINFTAEVDEPITDPTITVKDEEEATVTSIAFGDIEVNTTLDKAFEIVTANLTENLTLAISGTDAAFFTVDPTTAEAAGDIFSIEYAPTATGSHTATLTISNTANGINETYEITGSAIAPLPVITPTVNNSSLGIVDIQGNVITVLLEDCVKYANPAYTVTSGTATVVQEGDDFTVTATTDCTIQINLETISGSTVTLHPEGGSVAGDTELTQTDCSSSVILPEATSPCADWTFAGWATSAVTETTTAPTTLISAGEYTPTEDVNLYAVFSKGEGGIYTMTYDSNDGWDVTNTEDKNSYFLLNSGKYILSPELDYSTITDISVTIRTFGGDQYKTLSIQDESGNVWGTATATNNKLNEYSVVKSGNSLTGVGKLKILSTTTSAANGVGISEITITAGTTTYNSNPECTSIITDLNGTTADLGQIGEGSTTKIINVSGNNLTADITLAISGADAAQFDVDPKTISLPSPSPIAPKAPAATIGETPVTITYTASATSAVHNAILTISSTGAPDVVINLTGETDTVLGMSEASKDGVIVTTEGNNIVVKSAEVATVTLYSVSGKLISTHKVVDGKLTIPATKGAYIVKVGDKIAKVVL